jgi:RNA polymerase sigma-70 factor (ECF subfamily)
MSDQNLLDEQLVERVQRGDKNAFNLLVKKYQHKVVNLVARYVNNPGDVPDVAQEAFIKAYRALPTFRGESAFYTWLYRIAVNTAKNYLTSQGADRPAVTSRRTRLNIMVVVKPCKKWPPRKTWR